MGAPGQENPDPGIDDVVAADWVRILVCPACRGDLTPARSALVCPACALRYPVVDGVPHVIPERATPTGRATG